MTALYVLLALIGIGVAIFIGLWIRNFCIIIKFWNRLTCLDRLFKVYKMRKLLLPKYGYDYDTAFGFEYTDEKIKIEAYGSQRSIMKDLYEFIEEIDKLITYLSQENFEKDFNMFYELRQKIRMEKLACENTTL